MMWISELCPRPVFGPMSRQRLGNPAMVVPRRARMSSPQVWASVTPRAPVIRRASGMSMTWNPVAKTITSASRACRPGR